MTIHASLMPRLWWILLAGAVIAAAYWGAGTHPWQGSGGIRAASEG